MVRLTCITPPPLRRPAQHIQVNWRIRKAHRSVIRLTTVTMAPSHGLESTHLNTLRPKKAVLWYRPMLLFPAKGGGWADTD